MMGLPKNSRAKLYSTSTTVSQTQFFSPFFFFFILHSIHFWNREYLCVFGGVRKTRVFFWREIQFRHLASDNTLSSKKIPRNALVLFWQSIFDNSSSDIIWLLSSFKKFEISHWRMKGTYYYHILILHYFFISKAL